MVFVDNLDFVKGLPWWTHHMPVGSNGMTYVDMVFPAFLFVMGVSIPLAVDRRVAAGDSHGRIWLHNVERSLSLVVLGLFIANAPQVDLQDAGISAVWWAILGSVGIGLFWESTTRPPEEKASLGYEVRSIIDSRRAVYRVQTNYPRRPGGLVGFFRLGDSWPARMGIPVSELAVFAAQEDPGGAHRFTCNAERSERAIEWRLARMAPTPSTLRSAF